jgi:flagellar P-ring protein precursor FlgI
MRAAVALTVFLASAAPGGRVSADAAARIKEVASVQGVRANQLVGYGLVVGLDGTGDQSTDVPFTAQSLAAMLQQMGVTVPPGVQIKAKNVAAVMVTTMLPAFAQPGSRSTWASAPSAMPRACAAAPWWPRR